MQSYLHVKKLCMPSIYLMNTVVLVVFRCFSMFWKHETRPSCLLLFLLINLSIFFFFWQSYYVVHAGFELCSLLNAGIRGMDHLEQLSCYFKALSDYHKSIRTSLSTSVGCHTHRNTWIMFIFMLFSCESDTLSDTDSKLFRLIFYWTIGLLDIKVKVLHVLGMYSTSRLH